MRYCIVFILSMILFLTCAQAQSKLVVIKDKDIWGKVYKKTYYNLSSKSIDSTFYITPNDSIIYLSTEIKEVATPIIQEKFFELFVENHLCYPKSFFSIANIVIGVFIDKNGILHNIRILKGISNCDECVQNSIQMINMLQYWHPAIDKNGFPQDSFVRLVINFK